MSALAEPAAPVLHDTVAAGRSPALIALLDEHVEWLLVTYPTWASRLGDDRYNDRLSNLGPEQTEDSRVVLADRLERLRALDRSDFVEDDHVDADLLDRELSITLAWSAFSPEQVPLNAMWGIQVEMPQAWRAFPFLRPRHYDDYATRLERWPTLVDQTIDNMRKGMQAGRMPPRVAMLGTVAQCMAAGDSRFDADPAAHPMYAPFTSLDNDHPAAVRARKAIAGGIAPAMRRLAAFLEEEYIPACRESIGASDGIDGLPFYEFTLRQHTTTTLTADQIHQIGLDEVARIRAEMVEVMLRSDWFTQGPGAVEQFATRDAQLAAFINYLRTDPRFYHESARSLLDGYLALSKVIDGEMPRLFRMMPRLPYTVREMPAFMAPASPTAYYNPGSIEAGIAGTFLANTYRLDQRPKYEMLALTLHEAVPGHHHQIALANELEGVHRLRTMTSFTAFVEGWALYAESLGLDMGDTPRSQGGRGLYEDPYDDFGRLTYEMWRACRLVVDTGMHAKGWTRQRAIDFMAANSALSMHNIEREIDRYIGWPGQACGYKIGEITIQMLRRRAENILGERFDIRDFHDVVLGAGAVPLDVLERRVERWIERSQ
ncbi:MAG: DUF885 domain-containing protein [Phycisphaeraceae bacterium]|nr:DUF885 domain-containing protein [Phycisphaeraceae bacterium]MCW5753733.1 DUF885 domain-containing protein [Phycisphaeraceae bacterium]